MLENCPYCFEKFKQSVIGPQLEMVCHQNWGTKHEHTVAVPYDEWKKWKKQGMLPRCPGRGGCSDCSGCQGQNLSHRACPFCHTVLRSTLIDKKNLQLAIIGTASSGKTVYITMLLDYLQKNMGSVYGSPMLPLEASEGLRIRKLVSGMEAGVMPGNTTMDDVKPRLYQYGAGTNVSVMTMFDGAGEKFTDETLEAALMRYVIYASGMILLFDPTAIPAVRQALLGTHGGTGEMTSATLEDVLNGVQLTYENYNQWHGNAINKLLKRSQKLDIPVAVVFSKFDLVFPWFNQGSAVMSKSPNMNPSNRRFDNEDSKRVDKEIREWLKNIGDNGLIDSIDRCFSNVRYFGVSSLGRSPGSNATFDPHRIADPMLWLMHEKKMIP